MLIPTYLFLTFRFVLFFSSFSIQRERELGSEFDRYHVSVGTGRQPPIIVGRDDPRVAVFNEGLEPGRTYPVLVKTLSGNVASWPATANITTRKFLSSTPVFRN